jgi:tetratricopeptide (TPR) repeat protein
MLVPFVPGAFRVRPYRLTALSVIVPSLVFILFIDPELSLVRDWDLFAFPVAICVIPFLILMLKSIKEFHRPSAFRLMVVVAISLLMMLSWVFLNSNRNMHLQRAEYAIRHSAQNQRYGYELLAYYYSTRKDYDNELRMLLSIDPADYTARVYGKIAQAQYLLGQYDEAYRYAQRGARLPNPVSLNAIMAGITAYDYDEYDKAAYYLQIAWEMTHDPQWLCKLGDANIRRDSLDQAYAAYNQVLTQNSSMACAFFGIAEIHFERGEYEKAEPFCREGLRRDPNSEDGKKLWRLILGKK